MKFYEVVDQVTELLRSRGRLSYRVLKREFDLTEDDIEDLKEELIFAKRTAVDDDGRVLVWTGDEATSPLPASAQPPVTYTPQHLAERIRAEQRSHRYMEQRKAGRDRPSGHGLNAMKRFAKI